MLPFVKLLKSIDTYRDGGSMSISFISLTGVEHTLLFPVSHPNAHDCSSRVYGEPTLEIYRKVKRISHVTGLASYDTCIQKKKIKWQQSLRLLNQAQKHLANFQSAYINDFPLMLEIAKNKGLLANAT